MATTNLDQTTDAIVDAFGELIGLKSRELESHCKRVTAFTIALARTMRISGEQFRGITQGTFLHDVGMIGVPDSILFKPSALTAEEFSCVREHCLHGYEIVRKVPFLEEAAEIVYAHEERYDGSGYPRGLRGQEILLGARIFSVAHALDAITSERPYRVARSMAAARDEIANLAGEQFDPQVVRAFLTMPDSLWESLRREVDSPLRGRFTATAY